MTPLTDALRQALGVAERATPGPYTVDRAILRVNTTREHEHPVTGICVGAMATSAVADHLVTFPGGPNGTAAALCRVALAADAYREATTGTGHGVDLAMDIDAASDAMVRLDAALAALRVAMVRP